MVVQRGPCPLVHFQITKPLQQCCSAGAWSDFQVIFKPLSRLALTLIISQTAEMVSANEFAALHPAVCHSSAKQSLHCLEGKKKRVQGCSPETITAAIAHIQEVLNSRRNCNSQSSWKVNILIHLYGWVASAMSYILEKMNDSLIFLQIAVTSFETGVWGVVKVMQGINVISMVNHMLWASKISVRECQIQILCGV